MKLEYHMPTRVCLFQKNPLERGLPNVEKPSRPGSQASVSTETKKQYKRIKTVMKKAFNL